MRWLHYNRNGKKVATIDATQQEPNGSCFGKPRGFWIPPDQGQCWKTWSESEDYGCGIHHACHEVVPRWGARLVTLNGFDAMVKFTQRFGRPDRYSHRHRYGEELRSYAIDWQRVALRFDGILIPTYCWKARWDLSWFYGWDCASGCIWNPRAIETIRYLGPVWFQGQIPDYEEAAE